MKFKGTFISILISTLGLVAIQAQARPTKPLSPGRYSVNVMPTFNEDMAKRIEKKMETIEGLDSVEAHSGDSSLEFTVKKEARLHVEDLRKTLDTVDTGAVMTTPVLEGTSSTHVGQMLIEGDATGK